VQLATDRRRIADDQLVVSIGRDSALGVVNDDISELSNPDQIAVTIPRISSHEKMCQSGQVFELSLRQHFETITANVQHF